MQILNNKVAVITGSSKGIGSSIAQLFAEENAKIVINYRSGKINADKLVKKIKNNHGDAIAIYGDMTKQNDVKKLIDKTLNNYNKIDIWVNNASEYHPATNIESLLWQDYLSQLEGNLKSTYLCCHKIIPIMKKQQYGRIVNIITTLVDRPAIGYSAHITSKSAIIGLSRSLAKDIGSYGITINMVSPGLTLTNKVNKLPIKYRNQIAKQTPLKRLAEENDIAKAVLFFASDLSGFITGAYLAVDGGLSMPR